MIKESKYCSDAMEKYFNEEIVMTKRNNEDFENSAKCWICGNDYVENDAQVGNHCVISHIEALPIEIVISMLN